MCQHDHKLQSHFVVKLWTCEEEPLCLESNELSLLIRNTHKCENIEIPAVLLSPVWNETLAEVKKLQNDTTFFTFRLHSWFPMPLCFKWFYDTAFDGVYLWSDSCRCFLFLQFSSTLCQGIPVVYENECSTLVAKVHC